MSENKNGSVTGKPWVDHQNDSMNGCQKSDEILSFYNIFDSKTLK